MSDIYEAPLLDTPIDTWANTILWRLGIATGQIESDDGVVFIDPDDILDEALRLIRYYKEEYDE